MRKLLGLRLKKSRSRPTANYEVARARPSVAMLPTLAQLFGVSVDELLGLHKNGAGKRGPTPPLHRSSG